MARSTKDDAVANSFQIVAIGGSAGGIDAFFKFFEALDRRGDPPGMAFVVVLHLPPDQESHLVDLLRKRTALTVEAVDEPTQIDVDHVYILPPGKTFDVEGGTLLTHARVEGPEHHPVDDLFNSAAREFGERTVGIVCSGTGSNGSAGLGAIREAGGLTIAQDPETSEFEEMPRRSIETGRIDLVLSPEDMVDALVQNALRLAARIDGDAQEPDAEQSRESKTRDEETDNNDAFVRILKLLRTQATIDFRQYKTGTLHRRIDRRVHLANLEDWHSYANLLSERPDELDALMNDLLITVTGFFRDGEAWQSLAERVIEPLVHERASDDTVRVWVAGCATGEEAYSVGIALFERAEAQETQFPVEIFATDMSQNALSRARQGRYPAAAVQHLSQERRQRWFKEDDDLIDVKPELREAMIFAPQNLIQDPPFSRADIVICRNVLIYLKPEAQRKLIRLFHFSLKQGGVLFLGGSESIGGATDLFEPVDRSARIYRRVGATRHDIVEFPVMRSRSPDGVDASAPLPPGHRKMQIADVAVRAMVHNYAPPSVLIDGSRDILYYHGATYRFFKPSAGAATHNLMSIAHDTFLPHLDRIIEVAKDSGRTESHRLSVPFGDSSIVVLIEATCVSGVGEPLAILVSFIQEMTAPAGSLDTAAMPEASRGELEDEIDVLRASSFQSQRVEESLKAYNEEMTSMNEELRVTNEELETSKEELQSLNEELGTVNAQLRSKVSELQDRTADLNNLLTSTDIATLFLDSDLAVRWFSPNIANLFHIRQADIGRPISHVVRTFADDALEADCEKVLRTLIPAEAMVSNGEDLMFNRRISPYRTQDDRIAGVVVSLTDVSEIQTARRFAERIVETVPTPFLVLAPDFHVRSANPAFYGTFQLAPDQVVDRAIFALGNRQWDIPEVRRLLTEILPDNESFNNYEVEHDFADIGRKTLLLNARRLDHVQLILLGIEDITERRWAERHQEMLMAELGHRVKNALGVVQGLASQTLRRSTSLEEFKEAFTGRLTAYAHSHSELLTRDWQPGNMKDLVRHAIETHAVDPDRIEAKGPRVELSPKQALSLGLVLHELETNAVKYGALSNDTGRVVVEWSVDDKVIDFHWRETGGPDVATPETEGFGTALIQQVSTYDLDGTVEIIYAPTGLECRITFST